MAKAPAGTAPAKPKAPQPQAKAQPRKGGDKAGAAPAAPASRPKPTGDTPPRLRDRFRTTVVPGLMKERGYTNVWQVPRLDKVVINMGVGEGRDNAQGGEAG